MLESHNFIIENEYMRQRKIGIKTRSISGIVPSVKNNDCVWFESALERDFALLLESDPEVSKYQEQPITIEYLDGDRFRTYTPDFLVDFTKSTNHRPILCEIKYKSELRKNFSILKPKFRAAIEYCEEQDWEFKIVTEEYIRTHRLYNMNFLRRFTFKDVDQSCLELVIHTIRDLGVTTPEEFMLTVQDAHFNIRGRCLYALWYGIKDGTVGCDLYNEKINMKSEIWLTKNYNNE
jgi:hypothetical protein